MKKLLTILTVMGFVLSAGIASASTLKGEYWDVVAISFDPVNNLARNPLTTPSGSGVISNQTGSFLDSVDAIVAGRDADYLFESTGINYEAVNRIRNVSVASFLGSDGSTLTGGADNSVLGTILRLTGFVRLSAGANLFNIRSDDGYRLVVDGIVAGEFDGLRPPNGRVTNDIVSSASERVVPFQLLYFEAQTRQAQLVASLNGAIITGEVAPIPLPAGLPLILAGIAVFGGVRLRQRRAA